MSEPSRAEPLTPDEEAMVRAHHKPLETMQTGFFRCNCDFETNGPLRDDDYEWPCSMSRLIATLDAERAEAATPAPRVERLEAALDELPVLRMSGEALGAFEPVFFVDWDEHEEFVRVDDVRALLRSPQERSGGNPYETVSQERSGE
jgi:hypothetical protein